jgi:serine/threonine protein kinase
MLRALARAAFAALAELHAIADEHGPLDLAHGDLGPDHVMIGPATRRPGRVCFVDFGMASTRDDPARAGERGTLPFIAPEVARGEQIGDQRNDVYALAATMAFAALGRDPCKSADAAARLVEIGERGVDLEALASAKMGRVLRRVLFKALAFDPTERLQSARHAVYLLAAR